MIRTLVALALLAGRAAVTANCYRAFEADCESGKVSPWLKNHTCAECVKEVDEKLHKKDPKADCDGAAKEFVEKECKGSARTQECKGIFLKECLDKSRPAWTQNLTCSKCVEKVDIEIAKKKGLQCKEEAEVFIENKCGEAGSCTRAFEADCESGNFSPWVRNHTCAQCVKEVDEKLHKKDPKKPSCDEEAKEFVEKECATDARHKKCKEVFDDSCLSVRPSWTQNLTCSKCVEKVDVELLEKKGYNCKEEAEVFMSNKCGAKGSCKDTGGHDAKVCKEAKEKGEPCAWCPAASGDGGVCATAKTPCPK